MLVYEDGWVGGASLVEESGQGRRSGVTMMPRESESIDANVRAMVVCV